MVMEYVSGHGWEEILPADVLGDGKAVADACAGTTTECEHVTPYTRDARCFLGKVFPPFGSTVRKACLRADS